MRTNVFGLWRSMILAVVCVTGVFAGPSSPLAAESLKLALLPIPDVFPVYVAEAQGYFAQEGLEIEALPVGSAVERDQLLQAGSIDGMINEISGAMLFNREQVGMRIVSFARIPLADAPLFRVLAAPGTAKTAVTDLAGVEVAVSMNTVIEYVTERLLTAGGVAGDAVRFASVPVLPERLQLLLSGQIKAATLPDPLGFAALAGGAVEVVNDLQLADLSASVISFSATALVEKHEAVRKFMVAWDKAAADLNSDPEKFRELMLKKIRVPKNVAQSYQIPPFPRGKVPTKAQWDDVQGWLIDKKLLSGPVSYEDSVTAEFLVR